VTFSDLSSGSPTSWSWDFGDDSTDSTDQNPVHAYSAAGTYTVTLTVSNDCGSDDEIKTVYITVSETPTADFKADDTSVCVGYDVTFSDLSSGSPTSWSWDFGDDSTDSTDQNPVHAYSAAGTYTVTLTVSNDCGSDDEIKELYITVNDCRATITLHKTVVNGEGGTAVAGDFQPYINGLTQIDGQDVAWETAIKVPAGEYTVSESSLPGYEPSDWTGNCDADGNLTVESGGNYECSITNTGPVPNADFCAEVYEWVESTPSSYALSFPAASQIVASSSSASGQPRTPADQLPLQELIPLPAASTIRLLGDEVSPSAPAAPEGVQVCAGVRVLFTDLSSPSPAGSLIRWEWDFDNDGTIELTWTPFSGDVLLWTWDRDDDGTPDEFQFGVKATFEWVYAEPGTYTVKLTVTEDLGGTDVETKENYVTVSPSPTVSIETSAASWVVFVDELPITLTAATVSDCTIDTYEWRQSDVGTVGNDPTYTLPDTMLPGEYEFTVIVTCSTNCKDAAKATVTILDRCEPVAPDFGVCLGTELDDDLFIDNGAVCYDADGVPSFGLNYVNVNTLIPGTYEYTVTCMTECDTEPAVGTVTVYPLPTADAGSDHTIAAGDSLHIGGIPTASGGTPYAIPPAYEYSWTPTSGLSDPSVANPLAAPNTTTTYTVVVSDSHGCSDTDSMTITIFVPCDPTAPDFGVCQGTVLNDALFIDHGAVCYDENGVASLDVDYSNVNTNVPGQYQYMVMCTGPCVSEPAVGTVTVYPSPTASFTVTPNSGDATLTVEVDDNSTIAAGGTIVLWEWNLDGDPAIERTDASAPAAFERLYGSAGTYTVSLTVTTDHGCSDTTTRTIVVRTRTSSGGGGTWEPADPICFFDVDMMGEVTRVYVTCDGGNCIANYEPEDIPGENFLELSIGTRVTYVRDGELNGGPPRWVRMTESTSTPALPEGTVGVTEVYDFLGYTYTGLVVDSVIFDRPVGMLLDYDPDSLPENTVSVGIAVWDSDNNEWIIQPQSTGQVAGVGTATADVMHFSKFVVLATTGETVEDAPTTASMPAAPSGSLPASYVGSDLLLEPAVETLWGPLTFVTRTGSSVTVTATISNVGDESGTYTAELLLNGEPVGTQDVSLAGGEARQVKFVVSNVSGGDYRVQVAGLEGTFTTTRVVNWVLVFLLMVVLAAPFALLALGQRRRRKASQ
jgi:PKD repeat protein